MSDTSFQLPIKCHICNGELIQHPLYFTTGAQYCPEHGDFFVQRLRGENPRIIFRPYDEAPVIKVIPKRVFVVDNEKKIPRRKNSRKSLCSPNPPLASRVEWKLEPEEYLALIRVGPANNKGPGHPGINIRCDQTGEVFSSFRKLCDAMGLQRQTLSKYFRGERDSVGGYTFTKLYDPYQNAPPRKPPVLKLNSSHIGDSIRCDQTMKTFLSIRSAAEAMTLNRDGIRNHLAGKRRDVNGFTFTRVSPHSLLRE
jgi:hypothetical protein